MNNDTANNVVSLKTGEVATEEVMTEVTLKNPMQPPNKTGVIQVEHLN